MSHRLYIVTEIHSDRKYLVKAGSQSQAVHHIAREMLHVGIARPLEIAELMGAGKHVVDASTSKNEGDAQ